jgi:hypothetical protein
MCCYQDVVDWKRVLYSLVATLYMCSVLSRTCGSERNPNLIRTSYIDLRFEAMDFFDLCMAIFRLLWSFFPDQIHRVLRRLL